MSSLPKRKRILLGLFVVFAFCSDLCFGNQFCTSPAAHDSHDHHHQGCDHGHDHRKVERKLPEEDMRLYGFGNHHSHDHHHDHDHESQLSGLGLWVNAMGCSLLVSLASLICLFILPVLFIQGKPSKAVVDSLALFGAGAMLGDAFLHQLPHAFAPISNKKSTKTMELHLLPIFLLACTVFAANVVSLPAPEDYWRSKLPNTPIPSVLQQLLPGRAGNSLSSANDASAVEKEVIFDESYFNLKNPPLSDANMFFKYNSLKPGTKMSLFWSNAGNKVSFLTRKEAESIPFETKKLNQILQTLSIKPSSPQAETVKNTLSSCERPNVHGEDKFCATSLESLVDYTLLRLGKNGAKVISTPNGKKQEYTVVSGQTKKIGDRAVTCHRENYCYAVYMCHEFSDSEVHVVPLVGADGTRVNAISLCHMDTSRWNPDFFGFKALNTKPGQDGICHFINADGLVWY